MKALKNEIEKELIEHILPFWMKLRDDENGGFFGEVNYDLQVNPKADKGGIQIARFLWSFSAAYRSTSDVRYLDYAHHAFNFLVNKVYDHENKGLFWMVDFKGDPKDRRKHVYVQSFGIYALSEYYRASKEESALELAKELFSTVQEIAFQTSNLSYKEEFDCFWNELTNEMLSGNGVLADITMNTHIHILEAYTNLYRAWPSVEVKEALKTLLKVMHEKVYDQDSHFLGVFFDRNWKNLVDMKSFGHDIEASWLIDDTIKLLNIEKTDYSKMVIDIAYNISNYAVEPDGSLINEQVDQDYDRTRIWWVQAEAMVGFQNAYERTGDKKFLKLVERLWAYTKTHIIDSRAEGEWIWSREADGSPTKRNIGDPWKTPYHNSRFCLEMMKRLERKDLDYKENTTDKLQDHSPLIGEI